MNYNKQVVKFGRRMILLFGALAMLPPLMLWIVYNALPPANVILAGWTSVISVYLVFYIMEPIQYYPIVGASGVYMGFMAGNIFGIRVPSMIAAQKAIGVEQGTPESEAVSTIACAASVIVSTALLLAAALAGQVILGILPSFFVESLGFCVPAIMGALLASYLRTSPIHVLFTVAVGFIAVRIPVSFLRTPTSIIAGIAISILLYQMKKKKDANANQTDGTASAAHDE